MSLVSFGNSLVTFSIVSSESLRSCLYFLIGQQVILALVALGEMKMFVYAHEITDS